jgi:Putative adhesin
MNKQFIKIMIVLWSLIALLLTALLVYGITSGKGTNDIFSFGQWNTGSASEQKEEETSIDNCEKISLDFSSADIEISTSKESTLKIVQEARGTMKEAEKFSLARSGNIKIMSLYGSGQVKASSGNIIINYKDISEESTVEANSGNVILTVSKGISFEFYGKCSSGNINISEAN